MIQRPVLLADGIFLLIKLQYLFLTASHRFMPGGLTSLRIVVQNLVFPSAGTPPARFTAKYIAWSMSSIRSALFFRLRWTIRYIERKSSHVTFCVLIVRMILGGSGEENELRQFIVYRGRSMWTPERRCNTRATSLKPDSFDARVTNLSIGASLESGLTGRHKACLSPSFG